MAYGFCLLYKHSEVSVLWVLSRFVKAPYQKMTGALSLSADYGIFGNARTLWKYLLLEEAISFRRL